MRNKLTPNLFLAGVAIACLCNSAISEDTKPNIIFILADDLSYGDISCFGQKHYRTPNIDKMAAEGMTFTNAYAGAAWCAPSRTSFLTGKVARFGKGLELPKSERNYAPTVAETLKKAGYSTCVLGKWHMTEGNHSWHQGRDREQQLKNTDWDQMPWNRGFDVCHIGYRGEFQGTNGNPFFPHYIETGDRQYTSLTENHNITAKHLWTYKESNYDSTGKYVDPKGSSKLHYSEDIYREEALKFIRKNKNKPFFLYYSTPLVHGPLNAKSLGKFKDKAEPWSLHHKIWAAMVEELDRSVGILVKEVERLGLDKNTMIIFSSDNGYSQWGYFKRKPWTDDPFFQNKGGQWSLGKFAPTNGAVITPFIIRAPGRTPSGSITNRAINFYDFVATAAELSGVQPAGPTDGVSFVRILEGREKEQPLRNHMIWPKASINRQIPDRWAQKQSMKKVNWNAALLEEKYYALVDGDLVRIFDIEKDPAMNKDLSEQFPKRCQKAIKLFSN